PGYALSDEVACGDGRPYSRCGTRAAGRQGCSRDRGRAASKECRLMSKAAERIRKRAGVNIAQSVGGEGVRELLGQKGMRPNAQAGPSGEEGRTRNREAGHMDIKNIVPDPDQPRKDFDEAGLERLAHSLQRHGQLQPVRVRWSEQLGKWVILAG